MNGNKIVDTEQKKSQSCTSEAKNYNNQNPNLLPLTIITTADRNTLARSPKAGRKTFA